MRHGRGPARSLVRTLWWRLLAVTAIFLVLVGVGSVAGLRVLVDRNAERQTTLVAQTVATWGNTVDGIRVIEADQLDDLRVLGTVVSLLDESGTPVATSTDPLTTVADLATIAANSEIDSFTRAMIDGSTFTFTTVALTDHFVNDSGRLVAVPFVLVGVRTDAAERLAGALTVVELLILAAIILAVTITVTVVVRRTTRTLTALTQQVERGDLGELDETGAGYVETAELARAIVALDERRTATENELRAFLADTTHELGTPLTKIVGWSEFHFHDAGDGERTELAMSKIVEESHRMRGLVDQLTVLARTGLLPTASDSVVDLTAVARRVQEDVSLIATDDRVIWHLDEEVLVLGDEDSLHRMLRNLVGNALIHAGDDATTTVTLRAVGREVLLTVVDTGVGMEPEFGERAFDRFVTRDRRIGTGLGLPIVRGIVQGHGGTVALSSRPGEGTSVHVTLPSAP